MQTRSESCRAAFSLVEVMVASAVMAVIMLLIFGITQQTSNAWKGSASKIESFQDARAAFESMTRRISQATLNNYWGYDDPNAPTRYLRKSELHFICGKSLLQGGGSIPDQATHAIFFQAPMGYSDVEDYKGLDTMLNACGYYVEYNKDASRPAFLNSLSPAPEVRNRFRLMQFAQPAQQLAVYDPPPGPSTSWFTSAFSQPQPPVRQLAENVAALVILPKRSKKDEEALNPLVTDYEYDSRASASGNIQKPTENQLPPLVEVVMVAIDESDVLKLGNPDAAPDFGQSTLFQQADQLDPDLNEFQDILSAKPGNSAGNKIKLNYRIFRTDIPIHSSKWSE